LAVLCRNLSQGLHAAAQPLAILRASLDSSLTESMSAEDFRRLAASLALEVDRVCLFFTFLQQFVAAESVKPILSAMPILPLLEYSIDGVLQLFQKSGINLSPALPAVCPPVLVDRGRALQVFSTVLLAAHAVSRAGDTVEFTALESFSNTVRVTVRNLESKIETLDVEQRFGVALAEANTRSQQGAFSWSLNPFNMQIEFQNAPAT
jgi:hypothetical protein